MAAIAVGMIGAGETGAPLLKLLLEAEFVNVVGVADLDSEQPGMVLARQHGVKTTANFMDLAEQGENIDILIDVTGAGSVRENLRRYLGDTHNTHTIIMHEQIVRLFLSIINGGLVEMKHGTVEYK
jgi:acetaldehyde dehydrogenase (acetylating)